MEVSDIFVDLSDGRKLLKLLEIISAGKLTKPATGKMRVHKIETMNTCLAFLKEQNVKIGNIGAEDIVDGNQKLILGLIWSIILRFHIKDIEVGTSESESDSDDGKNDKSNLTAAKDDTFSKPKHSTKEALALWCQKRTRGYEHADVQDFTKSWRNGMAFNALIHSHDPKLVDYSSLNPNNHIFNLNNAFTVARDHLDIEPLLDAEDVDTDKPDEHSILTYVSSFYHTIANDGFVAADSPKKAVVEPEASVEKVRALSEANVTDEVVDNEFELVENLNYTNEMSDQTDAPEPSAKNGSSFEKMSQSENVAEPKVGQSNVNSETTSTPLAVEANEDNNNIFLWVIIVAVGFTILRNMFQNTSSWFMGDSTDNVEPSV